MTNGEPRRSPLFDVIGVGAGLAAYAYVAGGIVDYLRFTGASLPAFQSVSLLSDRQLVSMGVVVLLLAVPVGLVTVIAHWLLGRHDASRQRVAPRGLRGRASERVSQLPESTKAAVKSSVSAASIS